MIFLLLRVDDLVALQKEVGEVDLCQRILAPFLYCVQD